MSNRNLPKMSGNQVEDVAKVALGMLAIGLSAGFALIAGVNKLGHMLFDKAEEKIAEQTEEELRRKQ